MFHECQSFNGLCLAQCSFFSVKHVCVVYRSFPDLSMVCFSIPSALSLAFNLLLRLGHWTGVDEVPHLLNRWFEVDPFYIDSLLKTFCDASTPDPFVTATVDIVLQSDRWQLLRPSKQTTTETG